MTDGGGVIVGGGEDVRAELERLRERVRELEARDAAPAAASAGPGPTAFVLEAREKLLTEAEQIAHMGSFAWDVPTDAIHWSDELYRILGYGLGEVAPSQEHFFGRIHPADRDHVKARAEHRATHGIGSPIDFRIVHPSGAVRHAHMVGVPVIDGSGRPTRFVGVVLDVTERVSVEVELRRSEAVLKEAQRLAKGGSFEWNPWTGVNRWSEELYRIVGIPPEDPPSFDRYFALVHPEDRDFLLDTAASVDANQRIGPHEYRICREDGSTVHVYAEAVPVKDAEGNPAGFIGTVLDITQRKRLEAQLLQSQKMDALGRLAGGVAHDFNNLLTVIGVHVDLLRKRREERELAEVARAVERAGQLTRQLLAFSRQSVFELRRIEPVKTIGESLRMMKRIVGEDVQIAFDAVPDAGVVAVDPSRLEQVLLNLVVNARDALPEGGHVSVRIERVLLERGLDDAQPPLRPGTFVMLEVEDDGVGMDAEVRSRALEPFFTTKAPGRGTGLGLAMVFGIVSQSGGGVTLGSEKGVGTTVRVYLPAVDVESSAEAERVTEPRAGAGTGELLLLVDDDETLGRLLSEVLAQAGYRVHRASNGAGALAFFEAHTDEVKAVVTDVVMPTMGGPELVRRLRARAPHLPALYLSGYAHESPYDDDPATRGTFLMKPFSPAALVARVGELVASDRGD